MEATVAHKPSNLILEAYALAKANGGRLVKHDGGYWPGADWSYPQPSASTSTVEALVEQGMAYVSANHTNFSRQTYPTEITIKPLAATPPLQTLETDLAKLIDTRSTLRDKEFQAYQKQASRAKRTSYVFQINSLNAEIEVIRDQIKSLKSHSQCQS